MGLAFHLPSSSPASHGLVGGLGGGAGGGAVVPSLRSSGVAQLFPVAAGGNSLLQGGAFEDAPVRVCEGEGHSSLFNACTYIQRGEAWRRLRAYKRTLTGGCCNFDTAFHVCLCLFVASFYRWGPSPGCSKLLWATATKSTRPFPLACCPTSTLRP